MTTLIELRGAVEAAIRRGESFSTIEAEIVDSSRLPEDAQSALWLYAWSFVHPCVQRHEAYAHISQIAESSERESAFS